MMQTSTSVVKLSR